MRRCLAKITSTSWVATRKRSMALASSSVKASGVMNGMLTQPWQLSVVHSLDGAL